MARRDKTKKDMYMLSTLISMFNRGDIRDDHPQQRMPGRWGNDGRDGLVVTVLRDEDVDSIKICEQIYHDATTGRPIAENWLIDGLQRLSVLKRYMMGEFKLGKNIEMPIIKYLAAQKDEKGAFILGEDGRRVYEEVDYDLRGKGYNDLPEELKEAYDSYAIDVVKHLDCTDDEIGYHIRRYNRQTNMNGNEKAVTYLDTIAKDVKKIADNRFFLDCMDSSINNKKRSVNERVIMETLLLIFFSDNWTKAFRKQGEFLRENVTKNQIEIIDDLMTELTDVISEEQRKTFSIKNTPVWIKMFKYFKEKYGNKLSNDSFSDFLTTFEEGLQNKVVLLSSPQKVYDEELDEASFYDIDHAKGTKDKKTLENKLHIIKILMDEYFGKNYEVHNEDEPVEIMDEPVNETTTVENVEENNTYEMVEESENGGSNLEITNVSETEIVSEENSNAQLSDNDSEMTTLEFVQKYVDSSVTEDDLEEYYGYLDCCVKRKFLRQDSELINEKNENSFLALVAYSYIHDMYIDPWIKKYAITHKTVTAKTQKDNYYEMLRSLDKFMKMRKAGVA